nr:uncharacterized protein LOC117834204 [Setaria viridis]
MDVNFSQVQSLKLEEKAVFTYEKSIHALDKNNADEDPICMNVIIQMELKKCMTEDPALAAKLIGAAAIDALFTKEIDNLGKRSAQEHGSKPSHAKEDHKTGDHKQASQADEAVMVSEDNGERKGRSSPRELSDPAVHMAESGNDLDRKLENLQVDPSPDSSMETCGAQVAKAASRIVMIC